jgi:hypothetical protein
MVAAGGGNVLPPTFLGQRQPREAEREVENGNVRQGKASSVELGFLMNVLTSR